MFPFSSSTPQPTARCRDLSLDLQIYLDTHPHDTAMIQKMNGFKEKLKPLVEEYEEKFGPLKKSMTSTNMWSWIKGPWPWENEEDC